MTETAQRNSVKLFVERAKSIREKLVEMRRHIHNDPELSFQENKTGSYASEVLKKIGYSVRDKVGGTGVIADLSSPQAKGPIIAIRADMDALPIQEDNPNAYCSKNSGVMHACGHDAHTACALGAAQILADMVTAGELAGRFRMIFQPAEETVNADGISGATVMMNEGCLDDVAALVGTHVFPEIPVGMLGFRSGTFLAACDSFDIRLIGKGGHGAQPENTVDAIVLAAELVQHLQTIISRRKSALEPAVLTIGGIRSKTYRANIIAEEVELTGTIRYFGEQMSAFFKNEILKLGEMMKVQGARLELQYRTENPPLVNNEALNEKLRALAVDMIGESKIVDVPMELGAEDFSFYTNKVPSLFIVVGAAIEGDHRELHSPRFDINEDALIYGTAIMAASAAHLSAENH
ncbi:MAG: amidohydrolase [Candidatus Obscuribacterales bacterium]|jgi:amidohydrolase|nr:amidohydrolase [Candidatus Obscuribacterales bacterium]